jgi:hypothetical protein
MAAQQQQAGGGGGGAPAPTKSALDTILAYKENVEKDLANIEKNVRAKTGRPQGSSATLEC